APRGAKANPLRAISGTALEIELTSAKTTIPGERSGPAQPVSGGRPRHDRDARDSAKISVPAAAKAAFAITAREGDPIATKAAVPSGPMMKATSSKTASRAKALWRRIGSGTRLAQSARMHDDSAGMLAPPRAPSAA